MSGEPYYADEHISLYHGDALELMWELGNNGLVRTVDLVITSPPYNMGGAPWPALGHWKPGDSADGKSKWRNGSDGGGGVQYDLHEDAVPWDEYVDWQRRCLTAMWWLLSEQGAIFYNHKTRVIGGRLWTPNELIPPECTLRQELIWARAGGMNYNPTAYVPTHERIYVLAKEGWRLKSKAASGVGDVWKVNQEPSEHPAPFPIGIPARAIETTDPTLVLDPFAGSGTTLRAAKDAGVRAIGIEKSERYCEMAVRRLAQGSLFGEASRG